MLQRKPGCPCGGGCPRCQEQALLQTKLKIGEPGDKYEREADRIADEVMRMPEPAVQGQIEPEKEIVHKKAIADRVSPLTQTKESSEVPPIVHNVLQSPGSPLNTATRNFMESRFGSDFSKVRVHTDDLASESARMLGARAYTVDQNIVFNAGEYTPKNQEGKRLLAHELSHVIQQRTKMKWMPDIQRMTIGRGQPPPDWVQNFNARIVPQTDRELIDNAISMIREVANNPGRYSSCHQFFQENCPNGNVNSFRDTFNNAVLWKADMHICFGIR